MNSVDLIGRLTRDPEVKYMAGAEPLAVARFTLAIDRPVGQGKEKQTDFPSIVTFGRQAENCERYLKKGRLVAIQGRIQTGSYTNKDGAKVYTTDVVAERVEFLEWGEKANNGAGQGQPQNNNTFNEMTPPAGFQSIQDEDIPF